MSSGLVEESCVVVITTTPMSLLTKHSNTVYIDQNYGHGDGTAVIIIIKIMKDKRSPI